MTYTKDLLKRLQARDFRTKEGKEATRENWAFTGYVMRIGGGEVTERALSVCEIAKADLEDRVKCGNELTTHDFRSAAAIATIDTDIPIEEVVAAIKADRSFVDRVMTKRGLYMQDKFAGYRAWHNANPPPEKPKLEKAHVITWVQGDVAGVELPGVPLTRVVIDRIVGDKAFVAGRAIRPGVAIKLRDLKEWDGE